MHSCPSYSAPLPYRSRSARLEAEMPTLPHRPLIACALFIAAATSSQAGGRSGDNSRSSRVAPDLATQVAAAGSGSDPIDIIVQTDEAALPSIRVKLVKGGGSVKRNLLLVGGLAATVPVS